MIEKEKRVRKTVRPYSFDYHSTENIEKISIVIWIQIIYEPFFFSFEFLFKIFPSPKEHFLQALLQLCSQTYAKKETKRQKHRQTDKYCLCLCVRLLIFRNLKRKLNRTINNFEGKRWKYFSMQGCQGFLVVFDFRVILI